MPVLPETLAQVGCSAYALCGGSLLFNNQGVTIMNPGSGHVDQTLYRAEQEFPTSGFVISDRQAIIAGPHEINSFSCRN
jgi:hypothetical protein